MRPHFRIPFVAEFKTDTEEHIPWWQPGCVICQFRSYFSGPSRWRTHA